MQVLEISPTERPEDRYYVYVFVRQDIPPVYQLVQAAHVTLRLGVKLGELKVSDINTDDLYFKVIGVADGSELEQVKAELKTLGIALVEFEEPDVGNEVTAVATFPLHVTWAERKFLRDRFNQRLLKF